MAGLVEAQVARTPGAAAVVAGDLVLTYADLDQQAEGLARRLRGLGVGPEVLVGICAERSPELAVGLLAVLKAGGACVPLDPAYPAERLAFLLGDAAVPVLLTQERLVAQLPSCSARVLCLDAMGSDIDDLPAPSAAAAVATFDDVAYVLYTSGSTGEPKGVMLPNRALLNHHRAVAALYNLGPQDRVLQFCSMSFDVSVEEIFPTWATGGAVVLRDDAVPILGRDWVEWLRRQAVTVMNLPTAYWHEWVRDLDALGKAVPETVRLVVVGGEKALGQAYRTWLRVGGDRVRWVNAYGPSEATVMATYFEPGAPGVARPDATPPDWVDPPIGRPIANTTVHVLDPAGRPVEPGAAGELHIGGAGLARGYLRRPQLTDERFIPDPFEPAPGARLYRTGDVVRCRADGDLEFLGRLDQQVKVRGFRIECGEVEAALMTHPGVAGAAVVAREDSPGDRRLVAYVVGTGDEAAPNGELRRFLADRLPTYMLPTAFVGLDAFPRTTNGKLDRDALPAPERSRAGLGTSWVAPRTPTERTVAAIWGQVLGLDRVGGDDHFFELGGHSLLATQAISRMREAFGVEVALRSIFETPTVTELAASIDDLAASQAPVPPLVAELRQPGTRVPLSLAQEQMLGLEMKTDRPGLYNVTAQHRLTGPVDADVVRRALAHLVSRHETLRTSFGTEPDAPYQVVAASVPVELAVFDLGAMSPAEREQDLVRRICEQDALAFDLAAAPLFRFHLYRLDDRTCVLAATFDHMITDGTSAYVFLSELAEVYEAFAAGQAPRLRDLPVQYADFAIWQRRWLTDDRLQAQVEYWRQKLAGMPLDPAVPFDRVPVAPTRRIASRELAVAPSAYQAIQGLAHATRSTVFIVSVAAVQSLLSRYGGLTDIVLSTTLSGRQRSELEGLIGFFAGIARIRTDLSGDPPFEDVVARARDSVLGMFEHQDVPFMRVREALFPRFGEHTGGPGHPLAALPVEFQYFHAAHDGWAPGLAVVEQPGPDKGPSELFFRGQLHPLSITLLDDGRQLWGEIRYKLDFYDETTVEALAGDLVRLIDAVTGDPRLRLSQLPVALASSRATEPPAARHQLVGSWQVAP